MSPTRRARRQASVEAALPPGVVECERGGLTAVTRCRRWREPGREVPIKFQGDINGVGRGDEVSARLQRAAVAGLIALLAAACGQNARQQGNRQSFQARMGAGAECAELFEIRNAADSDSPEVAEMNRQLREVGCYSSSSTRNDQVATRERLQANDADENGRVEGYTMREYRIYRSVIDSPMDLSEDEALREVAGDYETSADEIKRISDRVQRILFSNGWLSTPEAELRRAVDWDSSG